MTAHFFLCKHHHDGQAEGSHRRGDQARDEGQGDGGRRARDEGVGAQDRSQRNRRANGSLCTDFVL